MKTLFKNSFKTGLLLIGVLCVFLIGSSIFHYIQNKQSDVLANPPGEMVEVNGHQMHIYETGNDKETLVMMAGGGTSSPVLDFKTLYQHLKEDYNIVVVEKAGYGYSEVTDSARDIDMILAETREALTKADITGPYILFPHSMSGIEALYWAEKYPDEVKAIVGLDMATPEAYEELDIPLPLLYLGTFAAKTGSFRWIPHAAEPEAVQYGNLTEQEKATAQSLFHQRTSTKNMTEEIKEIKKNAEKVKQRKLPAIPMLLFSSNGEDTGFEPETWQSIQKDFAEGHQERKVIDIEAGHYLHNIQPDEIAHEAKRFIQSLD